MVLVETVLIFLITVAHLGIFLHRRGLEVAVS